MEMGDALRGSTLHRLRVSFRLVHTTEGGAAPDHLRLAHTAFLLHGGGALAVAPGYDRGSGHGAFHGEGAHVMLPCLLVCHDCLDFVHRSEDWLFCGMKVVCSCHKNPMP